MSFSSPFFRVQASRARSEVHRSWSGNNIPWAELMGGARRPHGGGCSSAGAGPFPAVAAPALSTHVRGAATAQSRY